MTEYKALSSPLLSIEGRTVTGLASVFGNVDDGNDIVHPGSFTKTIAEGIRRVKHLWGHDFSQPPTATIRELRQIGKSELPESTRADFPDAVGGLLVRREYLTTPRAEEVFSGIVAGAVTEMSFGFDIVKSDIGQGGTRHIREVKLFETSDVQWGMNPATRAAKSAATADLEQLIHDMDGLATSVRIEIKSGRVINAETKANLSRVLTALQDGIAEADNQLNAAEPDKPLTVVDASGLFARLAIAEREFEDITR